MQQPDFHVHGGGTVYVLQPLSQEARDWVSDNLQVESWQFLGSGVGIEHRYIGDIVAGIRADGLTVS